MADVTKDDVMGVLKRIAAPDGRGNLISAGLVSDIVISSGNVMFALNADPQHLKTMEALRGHRINLSSCARAMQLPAFTP